MKLKYLAALLVLLVTFGCTQPASEPATPAPDGGDNSAATTETDTETETKTEAEPSDTSSTDAPETETQLAAATVRFDVTGMQ